MLNFYIYEYYFFLLLQNINCCCILIYECNFATMIIFVDYLVSERSLLSYITW
jgi:hypothetical protein